jgi:hypothetical protein
MHAKQQQGRGSGEVNLKKVRGTRYERKAKNKSQRQKPKTKVKGEPKRELLDEFKSRVAAPRSETAASKY